MDYKKSAVRKQITALSQIIKNNKLKNFKKIPLIVFLCGGNASNQPSFRRQEIKKFLDTLQDIHTFYAEDVYHQLWVMEGKRKNSLKVEQELFDLSNMIFIVLESESSFCELGAFSQDEGKRKKLLVVNNSKFKKSESFIASGPLAAIADESRGENIIYYKMSDSITTPDSIGDIFPQLFNALKEAQKRQGRVPKVEFKTLSRDTMLFISDLVYFMGRGTWEEILRFLCLMFPDTSFRHSQEMLSLLITLKIIKKENGFYFSVIQKTFFNYDSIDMKSILCAFRCMNYKYRQKDERRIS